MSQSKLFSLIACRIQQAKGTFPNIAAERSQEEIERLVKEFMPSGSGFDAGTTFDLDASNRLKMVFKTEFHHMNDNGMYDGWTQHSVIVTPHFGGFDIRVTGRNRNDIKDYIGDAFESALSQMITHTWDNDLLAFTFERWTPILSRGF